MRHTIVTGAGCVTFRSDGSLAWQSDTTLRALPPHDLVHTDRVGTLR